VPVNPPGLEVAVYVAAKPPVAPAVYATVACETPPVAVPIVGACGTVDVVKDEDDAEALDVLKLFVDVAVNVYAVPVVKPVTVTGLEEDVAVIDPGEEVTVYEFANPPPEPGVTGTDADDVAEYVDVEFD